MQITNWNRNRNWKTITEITLHKGWLSLLRLLITRNTAIADKLRDAFVQYAMAWDAPPPRKHASLAPLKLRPYSAIDMPLLLLLLLHKYLCVCKPTFNSSHNIGALFSITPSSELSVLPNQQTSSCRAPVKPASFVCHCVSVKVHFRCDLVQKVQFFLQNLVRKGSPLYRKLNRNVSLPLTPCLMMGGYMQWIFPTMLTTIIDNHFAPSYIIGSRLMSVSHYFLIKATIYIRADWDITASRFFYLILFLNLYFDCC